MCSVRLQPDSEIDMSRLSIFLGATFSLLICCLAFGQTSTGGTPPARPGSSTGAVLPGLPSPGPRAPQTGTGRIRGRILAAQTGTPLRRAQVTLGVPASQARCTLTDSDGRFEFAGVRVRFDTDHRRLDSLRIRERFASSRTRPIRPDRS